MSQLLFTKYMTAEGDDAHSQLTRAVTTRPKVILPYTRRITRVISEESAR